jgi:hypothetical protein
MLRVEAMGGLILATLISLTTAEKFTMHIKNHAHAIGAPHFSAIPDAKPVGIKPGIVLPSGLTLDSWLNEVAVGIICAGPQPIDAVKNTWMKGVPNYVVAHKRSHCAKHLSTKRCLEFRELYVMQDLVKTFPKAKFYFLTEERDYIDWDNIKKITPTLDPTKPLMVGYNEIGSGCHIKESTAHGFKNGMYMFSQAAGKLFAGSIATVTSAYEYHLLSGCNPVNLGSWGVKDLHEFHPTCAGGRSLDQVGKNWKHCQDLIDSKDKVSPTLFKEIHSKTCHPDNLVDDFGGWTVYYSGHYDVVKQRNDPRHMIMYWGQQQKVERKAWYCLINDRTIFLRGAIYKAGEMENHAHSKTISDHTFNFAAKEAPKDKPFVLGFPCSPQLIIGLDCLKHYKDLHGGVCKAEIKWCCFPRVDKTKAMLDSKCAGAKLVSAKIRKEAPTPAPTFLDNFEMTDTNKVTCPDSLKAKHGDTVKYRYKTVNFNTGEIAAQGVISGPLDDGSGWIKGLLMGLVGMCKGQKRHLMIPRKLGWGFHPVSSGTDGPVTSDVEMLSIKKQ